MKSWLQGNGKEIYSTHNEGKHIVAERFVRTLKNKIYKYMTSGSKNVDTDNLDDIVNKYNHTFHRTIKMKPVDVMPSTYIDFSIENNDKDHDNDKYIFVTGYTPNWSEGVFVIEKVKDTVPWIYVIGDLNDKIFLERFMELQKTLQRITKNRHKCEQKT